VPTPLARPTSALALALTAKRRRDVLSRSREVPGAGDVEVTIDLLRGQDEGRLNLLRRRIGERASGLVAVADGELDDESESPGSSERVGSLVAVAVGVDDGATLVAFARPGESLPLGPDGATLVDRSGVVLSGRGQCVATTTPDEALRALALRASHEDVVIYLGRRGDLDDEVAARCVTLGDGPQREGGRVQFAGRSWHLATPAPASARVGLEASAVVARAPRPAAAVRVHLLRAEPAVTGLVEPFAATLRRRCVEMTAYLAVHHHEPVTGERLRARVLGGRDDATLRTLANTASAVRRSLGADERGPRLHPVTPAGLYQLHDVDCDLVEFHQLVATARDPRAVATSATLRRALELVRGEPLAAALRGFEWFLAEGHLARLQRDGEWAALALAAAARREGEFDLAFWAIEQGRLIDPYSEALEAALARVPRLREFGGD
jgi:hypothetical protein